MNWTALLPVAGAQQLRRLTPYATLVRVLIRHMFVRIVTELKICRICEAVLWTIKIATHNLSQYNETGRMIITLWEGLNQYKNHHIHLCDWSYKVALFPIIILNIWWWDVDRGVSSRWKRSRSIRKDHDTLDVQRQVPHDTQFTFGSLTFAAGEDGNLKMLPPGSAPEHLAPVYGHDPCLPAISSTSDGACSVLNSYAGPYICTVKLVRDIPIGGSSC
jgi:hypothetical protein